MAEGVTRGRKGRVVTRDEDQREPKRQQTADSDPSLLMNPIGIGVIRYEPGGILGAICAALKQVGRQADIDDDEVSKERCSREKIFMLSEMRG